MTNEMKEDSGKWTNPGMSGTSVDSTEALHEKIYEQVYETLMSHQDIMAKNIDVEVEAGTVTLKGNIDSRENKKAVEQMVEALPGVERVKNKLHIVSMEKNLKGPEGATLKDLGVGIE